MKSRIHIEAVDQDGRPMLRFCYANAPYLIRNITLPRSRDLHLMVTSSSPGMLDGDDLDVSVELAPGVRMLLETQAYQRIFPSVSGCSQRQHIVLQAGSALHYVPHPLVPHYGAAFSSATRIDLHAGASLIWGEITASGRHLKDRAYRLLRSLTEIYRDDILLVRELVHFEPARMVMQDQGLLGAYTHQGSLLIMQPVLPDISPMLAVAPSGLRVASTAISGGIMVRALSNGGEVMFDFFKFLERGFRSYQPFRLRRTDAHEM